jgi:hypothetical protein
VERACPARRQAACAPTSSRRSAEGRRPEKLADDEAIARSALFDEIQRQQSVSDGTYAQVAARLASSRGWSISVGHAVAGHTMLAMVMNTAQRRCLTAPLPGLAPLTR